DALRRSALHIAPRLRGECAICLQRVTRRPGKDQGIGRRLELKRRGLFQRHAKSMRINTSIQERKLPQAISTRRATVAARSVLEKDPTAEVNIAFVGGNEVPGQGQQLQLAVGIRCPNAAVVATE